MNFTPDTELEEYTKQELRILNWCMELAEMQGFYGRLYRDLRENRELLREIADHNFTQKLDLILYVEQ